MAGKYSIVALGSGGMKRVVAYCDSFEKAFAYMDHMTMQGGTIGFHVKYDLLYNDEPFFWTLADAEFPGEVTELLDAWEMLGEGSFEEKKARVKADLASGKIVATGEVVAVLPE